MCACANRSPPFLWWWLFHWCLCQCHTCNKHHCLMLKGGWGGEGGREANPEAGSPKQHAVVPLILPHVIYCGILRTSKTQKMELRRSPEPNLWILSTALDSLQKTYSRAVCSADWVIVFGVALLFFTVQTQINTFGLVLFDFFCERVLLHSERKGSQLVYRPTVCANWEWVV